MKIPKEEIDPNTRYDIKPQLLVMEEGTTNSTLLSISGRHNSLGTP